MNSLGTSFGLGDTSQDTMRRDTAQGGAPSPIQDAIRTLSLRVPHITGGAPSLASNALLQGSGVAGIPSPSAGGPNLGLDELLKRLYGLLAPSPVNAPNAVPGMTSPQASAGGGGSMPSVGAGGSFAQATGPIPGPNVQVGLTNPDPSGGGGTDPFGGSGQQAPPTFDHSTPTPTPTPAPVTAPQWYQDKYGIG